MTRRKNDRSDVARTRGVSKAAASFGAYQAAE